MDLQSPVWQGRTTLVALTPVAASPAPSQPVLWGVDFLRCDFSEPQQQLQGASSWGFWVCMEVGGTGLWVFTLSFAVAVWPCKGFSSLLQKTAEISSWAPNPVLYSLCLATFHFLLNADALPYGKCSGMRKKICRGRSSTSCLSNSSMIFPRYQWLQAERQPDSSHIHEHLGGRQTLKRHTRWWKAK